MGYLERHTEERSRTLAVTGKVAQHSLHKKDGQKNIHQDKEKIIDSNPFEPGSVKTLNEEDQNMSQQKKRKDSDIWLQGRNASLRIDWNEGFETKIIGTEIGKGNGQHITEQANPDEPNPFFSDHVWVKNSFHFF
jgi:tRNA G46 methylase TrmB